MMYCRCVRPYGRPIVSRSAMLRPSIRAVRPLRGRTWQESRSLGAGSAELQPAPLDCAKNMHCLSYLALARFVVRPSYSRAWACACLRVRVRVRISDPCDIKPAGRVVVRCCVSWHRRCARNCRIYRKIDYLCLVFYIITYCRVLPSPARGGRKGRGYYNINCITSI